MAEATNSAATSAVQRENSHQDIRDALDSVQQASQRQGNLAAEIQDLLQQALGVLHGTGQPKAAAAAPRMPRAMAIEPIWNGLCITNGAARDLAQAAIRLVDVMGQEAETEGYSPALSIRAVIEALDDKLKKLDDLIEDLPMEGVILKAIEEDPHIAWARQADELRAKDSYDSTDEETNQQTQAIWALHREMAATPARTPAGIAEQIKIAIGIQELGCTPGETELAALKAAVASLEQMSLPVRPDQG